MTSAEIAFTVLLWAMVAFVGISIIFAIVAIAMMWRNR